MFAPWKLMVVVASGLLLVGPVARAQEAAAEKVAEKPAEKTEQPAEAKASGEPTHEVAKELLKQEIELDGIFEAQQAAEISIRPDVWQELSVLEAVSHGRRVEAGEPLVKLDMKKIDIAIAEAEAAFKLAELGTAQAKEEMRLAQESYAIDMGKAERAAAIAAEDLKRWNEIVRPMAEKAANFAFQSASQNLEYQAEELRQLEKMYKADEITEETEEIILKRTRNEVEQSKFMFERSKLSHEETLKIELPAASKRKTIGRRSSRRSSGSGPA